MEALTKKVIDGAQPNQQKSSSKQNPTTPDKTSATQTPLVNKLSASSGEQVNASTQPHSMDGPKIMRVKKRDGTLEPVDINKIVNVVLACSSGLSDVDPMKVATKAISGLYDGASTSTLDEICIQTASLLIAEDPDYSKLASRLMSRYLFEEIKGQGIYDFYSSVTESYKNGLISQDSFRFIREHKEALNITIDHSRDKKFEYFGLKTIYDRYLIKHMKSRKIIETPQYFFLRVACGLAQSFEDAKEFYDLISSLAYLPSSPTLFNSASPKSQLSSCYLLDSPIDTLRDIYQKYTDIALLSKFSGGIGVSFSKVRSRGSLIKGTNGFSNGIVPWLKTLDSSVMAVNQGGRRKGAACVYLETWHADIEEFLQLKDNTGDEAQRTHNLNLANWVSDLFMTRVKDDALWSLFSPSSVPKLSEVYGKEFEKIYLEAEKNQLFTKQVRARDLYAKMMKTLAQTGNGWMTFKDSCNKKCNQVGGELYQEASKENPSIVHLSNLCTEIVQVTSSKETAVCNLGSVNLSLHIKNSEFDFKQLKQTVATAIKYLDRVIDINFYPISSAQDSNKEWRPVGLGLMGLQDAFFKLGLDYGSEESKKISQKISEEIYFTALQTSCDLAQKLGAHEAFGKTKASQGILQFDTWGVVPENKKRWDQLKNDIKKHGLRNSLMIAIAPTATISSIAGVYESTEPQVSNLFKRETLSGEFLQVNTYLVSELKKRNLWTSQIIDQIKINNGSIQNIKSIPSYLKRRFKTVWEISQKTLIDMAAGRGPFIDQAQSLNLFIEEPNIGKLSSMYMYAWSQGVKTTYYLRSRPKTQISKTTVMDNSSEVSCSLENPETCESCQ